MNDRLEQVLNFVASELAQIDAITDAMVIRPRTITIHIDDTRILVAAAERTTTAEAALAERSLVAEQLSQALHVRDTQLAAVTADRDALAAQLAAVPVDALRRTLLTGYRTDAQITADADAINAWLGGGTAAGEQEENLVVDSIGGMCPTQAEGTMNGNPFYFRARHGDWTLMVAKPGADPVWPDNKEDVLLSWSGDDPSNGWMAEPDVMAILQRASKLLASARR